MKTIVFLLFFSLLTRVTLGGWIATNVEQMGRINIPRKHCSTRFDYPSTPLRLRRKLQTNVLLFSQPSQKETETSQKASVQLTDPTPPNEKSSLEESEFDDAAFDILAGNIALCLHKSDMKRDDGRDGASTGWTSWVDDASAFRLQSCIDALELCSYIRKPDKALIPKDKAKRDEAIRWFRWLKASPSPVITELSQELRETVNATIPHETFLREIDSTREDFLQRIGCRLMVLPSSTSFAYNLRAPPGAMVYGKLLFGGVTRFRMIGSQTNKRRAGARTVITSPQGGKTPSWLQYGGPERNFEAIDAGPCAFLEVLILPKGLELPLMGLQKHESQYNATSICTEDHQMEEMAISQMKINLRDMLELVSSEEAEGETNDLDESSEEAMNERDLTASSHRALAAGQGYIDYLESSFTMSVGGLQSQIDQIIRRVLDGRTVSSVDEGGSINEADRVRRQEMETLSAMGIQPVRGLLLYGPPGCGKTALAREISSVLKARPPKIVAAPELLDRWVGGSEKLVRELFQEAEEELRVCSGDPTRSALHVIVIDEIDAVFRKRSSASIDSSGETTRASAVNQILAKLDGVKELGNILLIGMTNRRELLDQALLRPGRLEVQIEIPLPDREGRREILQLHFEALRRKGLLSKSLCEAIDGVGSKSFAEDYDKDERAWTRKFLRPRRRSLGKGWPLIHRRIRDLADDRWTGGFSGADIAGLVRASGSLALARARKQDAGGIETLFVTLADVAQALQEIKV